jgi:guanylate kinase
MSGGAGRQRGSLFVIAAPSGAGKTSLVKEVLARDPSLRVSVSHTTRQQRPTEVPGRDYNFITIDEFKRLRDAGEFLEHAQVFDNFDGTGRAQVEALRNAGHDVILEIDWQGAQQVRKVFPDAVGVFVLPPSLEELEARLRGRGTDSDDVIARRLLGARGEMRHVGEFDYVILNQELQCAVDDLVAVVRASRLRYANQHSRHLQYFDFLEQD